MVQSAPIPADEQAPAKSVKATFFCFLVGAVLAEEHLTRLKSAVEGCAVGHVSLGAYVQVLRLQVLQSDKPLDPFRERGPAERIREPNDIAKLDLPALGFLVQLHVRSFAECLVQKDSKCEIVPC